jgi:hypothetical protein
MSFRTPRRGPRSRRHNPDAYEDEQPKTLRDYFGDALEEARKDLETRIPHVAFDDFRGRWGLRDLRLHRIPSGARGTLYLISATIGQAATSNTVAGTARALVRVSDKLRLPVLLHAHRDVELTRFVRIYDGEGFLPVHLHLPSGIPREFEERVYAQVLANGSVYGLRDALETLARYHFLVPEAYREQIGALAQQAFKDDDLAAYLQARELAALVSD